MTVEAALSELVNAAFRLCGGKGSTDVEILRGNSKMSKNQPEFELQAALSHYLRAQFPGVPFLSDVRASLKLTIPQQVRAKKIQADGFACPDMVIFIPKNGGGAMFLELKAETPWRRDSDLKKGEHLARQWETIQRLRELGYHADFYWDFEMAKAAIREYLAK